MNPFVIMSSILAWATKMLDKIITTFMKKALNATVFDQNFDQFGSGKMKK